MSLQKDEGPVSLGKALVFSSNNRLWACELNKVKEVVRTSKIIPLPNSKEGVFGVINVRGEVIPVVDKWPGKTKDQTSSGDLKGTVILLRSGKEVIGLRTDGVRSMEDIEAYDLGEGNDNSICYVYVSNHGQVPLIDARLVLEFLK